MRTEDDISTLEFEDTTTISIGLQDAGIVLREDGDHVLILPKEEQQLLADSPKVMASVLAVVIGTPELYAEIYERVYGDGEIPPKRTYN